MPHCSSPSTHRYPPYFSSRLTSCHLNSRNVSVSWKTTFPSLITATFNTFGRLGASGICGAGAGLDQWETFNKKGLQVPLDSLDNGFFGRGIQFTYFCYILRSKRIRQPRRPRLNQNNPWPREFQEQLQLDNEFRNTFIGKGGRGKDTLSPMNVLRLQVTILRHIRANNLTVSVVLISLRNSL